MKLTLTPTDQVDNLQGVPHRVWEGETDAGVPVRVWIAAVQPQTRDAAALAAFEAELREIQARRELVSFDLRLVI